MPINETNERREIIHGLLERIHYVASHKRSDDELYHLEVVLQNTLEKFVNEDTWEMFYSELKRIAQQ